MASNNSRSVQTANVKLKVDNLLVEKQEAEKRYSDKFTTVKERIAYLTDNDHDDVVRACTNADEGRYISKYTYGHNNDHDLVQYHDYLAHCVEKNKQFHDINLKKLYARLRELSNELTCAICLEKLSRDRFISCGCWHKNCDVCLAKHFTTIIMEGTVGNISEQVKCPSIGCDKEAPQVLIERVVSAETYRRYEYLALREAIGKEVDVCYCPMEQCTWFVEMKCAVGATCGKCGYNFCTRCRKRYHGDCDYDEARERQKVEHEQMSSTTVTNTTKTCPTCSAPIEVS
ncbi:unnamed protein product [Medioppia subpectinata]|uniref:RBR-type E3 ubiquitin transferase n=1 Tax=Medioppia subpectinata TaxID=1979941 RepID=A0A7R9KME1_9ACAR|nr:unnamed protein product [Medioppia subpectinata]CAG2105937.1 unnamed protein product [Medioppia subpectinata]